MARFFWFLAVLVVVPALYMSFSKRPRTEHAVPEKSLAVMLHGPHNASVVSRDTPVPGPGQVLVQMKAAPVNPSDVGASGGRSSSGLMSFPTGLGFEGAGIVVASGGGLYANFLVGQRVAVGSKTGGTWAEYCVAEAMAVIPIPKDVTFRDAASSIVNPVTVMGMLNTARSGGHSALVHTAAASQLGQMLCRTAAARGIPVIHIVRREEQAALLRDIGGEHVLVSTSSNFEENLERLARDLGATIAFDAIAGSMTAMLVEKLPPKSEVYVYGRLSNQPVTSVEPLLLMRDQKQLHGFQLAHWLGKTNIFRKLYTFWEVMTAITTHFRTDYAREYALTEAICAVVDAKSQSKGKGILLTDVITESSRVCTLD